MVGGTGRVNNDSSLFAIVRADGWKNKEASVGLFNALTLTGTKQNEETLDLKTAKNCVPATWIIAFFFFFFS